MLTPTTSTRVPWMIFDEIALVSLEPVRGLEKIIQEKKKIGGNEFDFSGQKW